jgi:hypothetical protein
MNQIMSEIESSFPGSIRDHACEIMAETISWRNANVKSWTRTSLSGFSGSFKFVVLINLSNCSHRQSTPVELRTCKIRLDVCT